MSKFYAKLLRFWLKTALVLELLYYSMKCPANTVHKELHYNGAICYRSRIYGHIRKIQPDVANTVAHNRASPNIALT